MSWYFFGVLRKSDGPVGAGEHSGWDFAVDPMSTGAPNRGDFHAEERARSTKHREVVKISGSGWIASWPPASAPCRRTRGRHQCDEGVTLAVCHADPGGSGG